MLLAALALGLAMGLVIGALGGGGSILTVPALVFVLGLDARSATSGSLVIVGVTAVVASLGHSRSGNVRWRTAFLLAGVGIPASLAGTELNRLVAPDVLLLAFAGLMVVAAVGMLLRSQPHGHQDPDPPSVGAAVGTGHAGTGHIAQAVAGARLATSVRLAAGGLLIGFLTGFLGVGGGFVIVPVLVLALRFQLPVAIGTSLLVIALNTAVSLAARAGTGSFAWNVVLPFTGAAVVGALAGKGVADRASGPALTRAFSALMLLVAGYVVLRAMSG